MLKNYLKVAFRVIKRQSSYSFINIAGLTIGMTCSILILMWVRDEVSFDKFHANIDTLYRVVIEEQYSDHTEYCAITAGPYAEGFKNDFPEVIKATALGYRSNLLVKYNELEFYERRFYFAQQDFFEIFSFDLLRGDPETVLADPLSVVLTKTTAEKYFGEKDPVGEIINIDNSLDFLITGIVEDPPGNSSIKFDFIAPFVTLQKEYYGENSTTNWGLCAFQTFIQLAENTSVVDFNNKIYEYLLTKMDETNDKLFLQPLERMHLYSNYDSDNEGRLGISDIRYVYIFMTLAVFILVIACINFMNLATAKSGSRAKEVGMRKVAGANRANLIKQFLGETILLSLTASLLAVALVEVLLPGFNELSGKNINIGIADNGIVYLYFIFIAFFTGIISGSYPAFYLSGFQPVKIIKGVFRIESNRSGFRRILVVTQFSISIILIISAVILSNQLDFIRSSNLGYSRDNIIYVRFTGDVRDRYPTIKEEYLKNPYVVNVTASQAIPVDIGNSPGSPDWEGKTPEDDMPIMFNMVDFDYIETFGMEMVEGRSFSKEFTSDAESETFIVNEEAVRLMRMEDPVGKSFGFWGNIGTIAGVVKDFNFQSLHNQIKPFCICIYPPYFRFMHIKIDAENVSEAIGSLEDTWKSINPDYPFEYHFLDEDYETMYRSEQRLSKLLNYFTFIGIFISCLGLIGLASYTAERRTKEVGVRKVLGASVFNIIRLLSSEFFVLVLISNVFAWPTAYYFLNLYLENFAYRINIDWSVFIIAGLLTMLTALITVSFQAVKAAVTNPVESLRNE